MGRLRQTGGYGLAFGKGYLKQEQLSPGTAWPRSQCVEPKPGAPLPGAEGNRNGSLRPGHDITSEAVWTKCTLNSL